MKINFARIALFGAIIFGLNAFWTPAALAQTRTWVSGVGDDVNPCSRTAPCKTFAGAISKTAAGGEINCLDPGGFGAVTITKAITINCVYTEGGALAGGNGITVNAGANDVVVIRGLDIYGVTPSTNGVRFIAGGALHIEDSTIRRFNSVNSRGVSFQPSGASTLYISNTTITENGNGATGGGILIQPTGASGSARVVLRNVRVNNNANQGFRIDTTGNTAGFGISVVIDDSSFVRNGEGLSVNAQTGTTDAVVMVTNSVIANNTGIGISASGTRARFRVGNTTIHGNATGVQFTIGALINTYGNNYLDGNGSDGLFTAPSIPTE